MKSLIKVDKENIKEIYNKFKTWLSKDKIIDFISTFVFGFITHILMITGTIMSQDGLLNSMSYSKPGLWEIALGRWGILLTERLNNFVAIPSVATVTCLLLISVASIFLIDLFDIKNRILRLLTSLVLVVTPTLTITLLYIYTSVAYCFALMSSILCIWFLFKFSYKKLGFILSILAFSITIGIYQSYIGVSIGLCVMMVIIELIKSDKEIKEILFDILKSIVSVLIGTVLYIILTYFFANLFNVALADYKGSDNISILNFFINLKDTVFLAYRDFYTFYFLDVNVYNTNYRRDIFYFIFFLTLIVFFIRALFNVKKEKCIRIISSVICFTLLPVFLNIIDLVLNESHIYALTSFQMILIIPFCIALLELINDFNIIKILSTFSLVVICFTYYISDNDSYVALKMTYNQNYSIASRMIDRIENLDGYNPEMKVSFMGIMDNNNFPRKSTLYSYTVGSVSNNPVLHGDYNGQQSTWYKFLEVFFGMYFNQPTAEEYYNIVNSEEFKNMEIFPYKDSVKIIDDVVVVKIKEIPAMPY